MDISIPTTILDSNGTINMIGFQAKLDGRQPTIKIIRYSILCDTTIQAELREIADDANSTQLVIIDSDSYEPDLHLGKYLSLMVVYKDEKTIIESKHHTGRVAWVHQDVSMKAILTKAIPIVFNAPQTQDLPIVYPLIQPEDRNRFYAIDRYLRANAHLYPRAPGGDQIHFWEMVEHTKRDGNIALTTDSLFSVSYGTTVNHDHPSILEHIGDSEVIVMYDPDNPLVTAFDGGFTLHNPRKLWAGGDVTITDKPNIHGLPWNASKDMVDAIFS